MYLAALLSQKNEKRPQKSLFLELNAAGRTVLSARRSRKIYLMNYFFKTRIEVKILLNLMTFAADIDFLFASEQATEIVDGFWRRSTAMWLFLFSRERLYDISPLIAHLSSFWAVTHITIILFSSWFFPIFLEWKLTYLQ